MSGLSAPRVGSPAGDGRRRRPRQLHALGERLRREEEQLADEYGNEPFRGVPQSYAEPYFEGCRQLATEVLAELDERDRMLKAAL